MKFKYKYRQVEIMVFKYTIDKVKQFNDIYVQAQAKSISLMQTLSSCTGAVLFSSSSVLYYKLFSHKANISILNIFITNRFFSYRKPRDWLEIKRKVWWLVGYIRRNSKKISYDHR